MTTVYVSALNNTQTLGSAGTFAGASIADSSTTTATTLTGIATLTDLQAAFRFYTTPSSDGSNATNFTGVNKATTTTCAQSANSLILAKTEMLGLLAAEVFGSNEAGDLFSNNATITDAVATAMTSCVAAVNASSNNGTASTQMINGLLNKNPERFELAYKVEANTTEKVLLKTNATIVSEAATYTNVQVWDDGADSGGKVTVVVGANNIITSIAVTTPVPSGSQIANGSVITLVRYDSANNTVTYSTPANASQIKVFNTGAFTNTGIVVNDDGVDSGARVTVEFGGDGSLMRITSTTDATTPIATGSTISFVNAVASGISLTLTASNSVQTAILNGTLDSSAAPCNAPLESGDILRVLFIINSHATQTNASGDAVSVKFEAHQDFTMS